MTHAKRDLGGVPTFFGVTLRIFVKRPFSGCYTNRSKETLRGTTTRINNATKIIKYQNSFKLQDKKNCLFLDPQLHASQTLKSTLLIFLLCEQEQLTKFFYFKFQIIEMFQTHDFLNTTITKNNAILQNYFFPKMCHICGFLQENF